MSNSVTNVVGMPPSDHWTPAQALAAAQQMEWQEAVVIGGDRAGEPSVVNSRMSKERMLWLAECLRDYAMTML